MANYNFPGIGGVKPSGQVVKKYSGFDESWTTPTQYNAPAQDQMTMSSSTPQIASQDYGVSGKDVTSSLGSNYADNTTVGDAAPKSSSSGFNWSAATGSAAVSVNNAISAAILKNKTATGAGLPNDGSQVYINEMNKNQANQTKNDAVLNANANIASQFGPFGLLAAGVIKTGQDIYDTAATSKRNKEESKLQNIYSFDQTKRDYDATRTFQDTTQFNKSAYGNSYRVGGPLTKFGCGGEAPDGGDVGKPITGQLFQYKAPSHEDGGLRINNGSEIEKNEILWNGYVFSDRLPFKE